MRQAFVDTGGFFAFLSAIDEHHARADALFAQAARERWRLVTTNAVVFETHALLLQRGPGGRRSAIAFLDAVESGVCRIERLTVRDERRATALVRAHADKDYSLCDASCFVVMERLRIHEAISFDRHFREYGRFVVL